MTKTLPPRFLEIKDNFLSLKQSDRLLMLLEFADSLPELPERYLTHPDLLERVEECQAPVYIFVELNQSQIVHFYATAPMEAPTTRGFASILSFGINGLTAADLLNLPDDYPQTIGLAAVISPLRLRGMTSLLGRAKRQVQKRITEQKLSQTTTKIQLTPNPLPQLKSPELQS